MRGLGIIDAFGCPHFDSETAGKKRNLDFQDMILKHGGTGIGIDNDCALEFVGDGFRVISSKPTACAYKLLKNRGKVTVEQMRRSPQYLPISSLLRS